MADLALLEANLVLHECVKCERLLKKMLNSKECRREDTRTCITTEYWSDQSLQHRGRDHYKKTGNPNGFSYEFELQVPKSSRGDRESKPYKSVKTEQLLWGSLPLVAEMGGILAMTIEFSFLGAATWIMNKVAAKVISLQWGVCEI